MEVFGVMGFIFGTMGFSFGLIAFTTGLSGGKEVKELEKRIIDLEDQLNKHT
jgi:hypothetical protein